MAHVFAEAAYLEGGWARDVRIMVGEGRIEGLRTNAAPEAGDVRHAVVVPGTGNLHSHAFQRAMAGLAERRGPAHDNFWSWRQVMYGFALAFRPEQLEAVAAQLYMEMLEAGFTRVGEFHYLHHDRDGRPYANIAEHAERIVAASVGTGIGLTLLPVFYAHGGFGGTAPAAEQRRFISSLDGYGRLFEACRALTRATPGARLGIAPHSLRAVTPSELHEILPLAQGGPVHIHVAEQTGEVEDSIAWAGARPVEWLLANAPVSAGWTLIHATHTTEAEVAGMARAGATAGLCPITEANLGDGIFSASPFLGAGGRFGVGSDSNLSISLAHELRQLEYSQRLALRARNVIAEPGRSTGERLFREAVSGAARSLYGGGHLAVGADADLVALDLSNAPHLSPESVLDNWIFGDGVRVDGVWVRGRQVVSGGRHVDRDRISAHFHAAMRDLLEQMAS